MADGNDLSNAAAPLDATSPNDDSTDDNWPTVIIGGGPAGLTAAYELHKAGHRSIVLEADSIVGGISRTEEYKGYRFDMGGHRFFTKISHVEKLWHEVLGADLLKRERSSRILYKEHFYEYPLEAWNILRGLGLIETARCAISYMMAILFPKLPEPDFETFICNRFGRRLFQIFFRTYTEKVWGIPCNQIQAEWAAQRIKGLSITQVVLTLFKLRREQSKNDIIKTLIRQFDYPRHGPGMMWTRVQEIVDAGASRVELNAQVTRVHWEPGRITAVEAGGKTYKGDTFISSMPIRELIDCLHPRPPEALLAARDCFSYRDFLTVALIARGRPESDDNWIYIHDPGVRVGRIQIFNNWSPEMVPDPETTCYGFEYFCFENDGLWSMPDRDLIALAEREMRTLGIADHEEILDGIVMRVRKAYPVYDDKYKAGLDVVRAFLTQVPNLQLVGRNGMHKYNNQDHSMLTAMLAARNVLGAKFDLWQVNVDPDYQEEGREITEDDLRLLESTQPPVPTRTVA